MTDPFPPPDDDAEDADVLASAYLDDELTGTERERVAADPEVLERVAQLRPAVDAVARPVVVDPDRRDAAIAAALASSRTSATVVSLDTRRRRTLPVWSAAAAIAVVFLAAALALGLSLGGNGDDADTASEEFSEVEDAVPDADESTAGAAASDPGAAGDDAAADDEVASAAEEPPGEAAAAEDAVGGESLDEAETADGADGEVSDAASSEEPSEGGPGFVIAGLTPDDAVVVNLGLQPSVDRFRLEAVRVLAELADGELALSETPAGGDDPQRLVPRCADEAEVRLATPLHAVMVARIDGVRHELYAPDSLFDEPERLFVFRTDTCSLVRG